MGARLPAASAAHSRAHPAAALSRESERRARAERLGDYFALQLRFAEHMAARAAIPLAQSLSLYTNLRRRLGLGYGGEGPPPPEWLAYLGAIEQLATSGRRLDFTKSFYVTALDDIPPSDHIGPLSRAKTPRRLDELKTMFAFVRETWPETRAVHGGSWLYNLEAYRRLFPPAYGASRKRPSGPVGLSGTSSWGQFLDHREAVKPDLREAFLHNLKTIDVAAPWRAFPLPALRTRAPIEIFYDLYGV
jgi:hypothetical protein